MIVSRLKPRRTPSLEQLSVGCVSYFNSLWIRNVLNMGRDVLFTSIFQDRAVTMGLADGTYSVLEDTVTSLLKKEGQTLQFNWFRSTKSRAGLLKSLLTRGEGPTTAKLNTTDIIDLAFI